MKVILYCDKWRHKGMDIVTKIYEIRREMSRIKKLNGSLIHNFFINEESLNEKIRQRKIFLIKSDRFGIILQKRVNVWQVGFFATDVSALNFALIFLKKKNLGKLIIDLPNCTEEIRRCIEDNGFKEHTRLLRLSRFDKVEFSYHIPNDIFARQEELNQIESLLYGYLDCDSDQLPDNKELSELIDNQNVLVLRTDADEVASVIIFEIKGKFIHWRYWVTAPEYRANLYGMKLYTFFNMYMKNFTRQVLFIHKGNPVAKIHTKAGFGFDGFEDLIYVWEGKGKDNGNFGHYS